MKPIEITANCHFKKTSQKICEEILDTNRWDEFEGYSFLPGIESANFEIKTPAVLGSRIKVKNRDGSSHIEEIIEWDVHNKGSLRLQEFDSPLKNFATHFLEVWTFSKLDDGTTVSRAMTMYPKGILGWLILKPISKLMKKALVKHLIQLSD